jgi:hypothetical protein
MLPLPISPADALLHVIGPALALLPCNMNTPAARVLLLAIALQESALRYRRQVGGPAVGLWQFERGGGVRGVLQHRASRLRALMLCEARGVPPTDEEVYEALERDDVLAAGFARLLLWTDPMALPRLGYEWTAWEAYIRTWRPGKPHSKRWPANYASALAAVKAEEASDA